MNQVLFDSTFITVVGVDVVVVVGIVVVYYPILPTSIFEARTKGVPLRGMMFNIRSDSYDPMILSAPSGKYCVIRLKYLVRN